MATDPQFITWWTEHFGNPPIPRGFILPVQHAIQGHPESPRLWEAHINEILSDFGFKSTTHERCIYKATIDGKAVLFLLRQVDDFAVACKNSAISKDIITNIGARLSVPLHQLSVIKKLNGIDIVQSQAFIKISCTSYLDKVLDGHNWQESESTLNPIHMRSDSTSQGMLESTELPSSPKEQKRLHDAHFNYR